LLLFEELGRVDNHIKPLDKTNSGSNGIESAEIAVVLEASTSHGVHNHGASDGESQIVTIAS